MPVTATVPLSRLHILILRPRASPRGLASLIKVPSSPRKRGRIPIARRRRLRLDSLVPQLLLQIVDIALQRAVLALDVFSVASTPRQARDAIGGTAFGVVLRARRAPAWSRIAADLPDLFILCQPLPPPTTHNPLPAQRTHLAPITSLARPTRTHSPSSSSSPPTTLPLSSTAAGFILDAQIGPRALSGQGTQRILALPLRHGIQSSSCLLRYYIDVWKLPRDGRGSCRVRVAQARPEAARTANSQQACAALVRSVPEDRSSAASFAYTGQYTVS